MPDSKTLSKQSARRPPCRIYAIMARDAPVGVIFRRGPSKRVQIVHWDTETDTFTPGQWFHGRIYEQEARLSADGTLMRYDAMKINQRTRQDTDYGFSWTAISKPPYLRALTRWASGTSTGTVHCSDINPEWLIHWNKANHSQPAAFLARNDWRPTQEWQDEFESIKNARLAAFQERMAQGLPADAEWLQSIESFKSGPNVHEKDHPHQSLTLVRATSTECPNQYEYSLRERKGREKKLTGMEWVDWDQRGRFVYAQGGCIFACNAEAIGQDAPRELINLNRNRPKHVVAPDWAKTW